MVSKLSSPNCQRSLKEERISSEIRRKKWEEQQRIEQEHFSYICYTYFSQVHMNNIRFSQEILVFHGRTAPETGFIAGYGALIQYYELNVPIPQKLALISKKIGIIINLGG